MSSSAPSLATNATSTPTSSAPGCSPPAKLVLNLPPGYHFLPTDDELVVHYLRPRLAGNHRLPLPIFVNERILNYHPDVLIAKYRNYGEGRWFFFTERERKHLGGNRPNRTTPDNGHWNATGSIKPIRSAGGVLVGCRRTLVFYEASRRRKKINQAGLPAAAAAAAEDEGEGSQAAAKAKDGVKTEWTMYEYESLTSEAEFETIRRSGNAHKMDVLVLCTIQKKKHGQEGKEGGATKKGTKRKRKDQEGLLEVAVPAAASDVEQGNLAAGTTEGQDEDEDHVQRALMEAAAAAAAEPQQELAAYHDAPAGAGNFNVDPNKNMPYGYDYLINSLSHVPTPPPPQETVMAPSKIENHTAMHQQNYYFINHSMNMKNSQSFPVQETPPQEFLPYSNTNMAAPSRGGGNTMDHMLQNRFVNMTPSQQAPPVSGTYVSPGRSKSDKSNMPLKSEDAWWSSNHQAKLSEGELNSPYANSLSLVPTARQETVMETVMAHADRGYNHTVMHQRNYSNLSMNMRNSQFHVQAALPREEFLPYSITKMAAAPLGGGGIMDHHMLQNRIVNMMPAAQAHTFSGFCPGLSNSNYGHLSTRVDHPAGSSSFSFPSQQSHGAESRTGIQQGLLLNNQVNLNHQNQNSAAAASMVGYDQRSGAGLAPKIV